jgi:CarD family transcriptional regulator
MAQKKQPAKKAASKKTAKKPVPVKKAAPIKKGAAKKTAPVKASAKKSAPVKKAVSKKPVSKKPISKKEVSNAGPSKKATPVKKQAKKAAAPTKVTPTKVTPAKAAPVKKAAPSKPAGKPSGKAESGKTTAIKETAKAAAVKEAASKSALKKAPVEKAPVKVEPPPPPPKPVKATSRYNVGDKVVHPQHGAATIARRIKREFGGVVRDYYVLDISTESLTVMVPVEKVDSVVRSVISKTQSKNVLGSLRDEPQEAGANWSRWYKVLTEKMYSGDIFQVAEVVRDLSFAQQTKGISPALKRMLSKARMTLISELSFSLEVDEEEATKRLDKALPRVENALIPIE